MARAMRSCTFCEGFADHGTVRPNAFCRFSFSFFGAFSFFSAFRFFAAAQEIRTTVQH
jgi:hypothetical protein